MTDELLQGLAAQITNMAKTELRYRHQLNGILASYFEGEGLQRLRSIEKVAEERLGRDWLNSGGAKDVIFGVMSVVTRLNPPAAIAVCTAINDYEPTPAMQALPEEEYERIAKNCYPRDYPQYFTCHDALMAMVQTPERICIRRQKLKGTLVVGEPKIMLGPLDSFHGRLRFFGGDPPDEVEDALNEYVRRRAV